jgi:hypothetical protein
MGQGQAEVALTSLAKCSAEGGWLLLQNLHLTVAWLPALEQAILNLQTGDRQPHPDFKLWLTTESHPNFATNLLQMSRKITYEVSTVDFFGGVELILNYQRFCVCDYFRLKILEI